MLEEILNLLQQQPPPPPQPDPTPPTTVPPPDSPNPRLTTPQNITVNTGQTIDVTLTLRNIGMGSASNILSQALPSSGAPFTVEFINNSNNISSLAANSTRNMTLRITVNANAESGNHQINLTHLFRTPSGTNTSTTDVINVRVIGGDEGRPNVNLSNFRTGGAGGMILPGGSAPIGPGQSFTLSADISNLGNVDARNVQISLPNLSADTIFFTGDLNQFFFANMEAGHTSTLSFPLRTSQNITSGTHQIDFRLTFRGESGDPIVETFPAFVTVYVMDEVETNANLEIRGMTSTTGNLRVGQTGTVSFYVHNTGDAEARNVRVVATPESQAIIPVQTSRTQVIPVLAPGASHRLTFNFSPTELSETRSYGVGFVVGSGENAPEQFAVLNVYNPDRQETTTPGLVQIPRVIVAALELYPTIPRAGQEFTMEVTFRNTSATRSVNNIRILMEEAMGSNIPGQQSHFAGFNPVGGSNALFVDFLEPLGEIAKTLRFTTVTEATPGAHNMRFRFDYQDQDFHPRDAEQQISISVAQVTRLELADVSIGGWVTPMVGMPVPFNYNIINSGRVNLINVRTSTEGPFDVAQGGRFIGTINSQRMAGFDGAFIPHYPGEQSGVFIISGEDVTGEIVEIRYEFTVFVEGGWDGGGFDEGFLEGGGMGGDFTLRPGDGMGDMGMIGGGDAWCHVAGEMVQTGYWSDTGEWVSLGEWCMETGAWLPASSGFDFLGLIQRPVVWGSAIAVVVIGAVVVIVIVRRKRPQFDVDLDD